MVPLDLISIRHDGRHAGDQFNRLTQHVLHRQVIRYVIIGIQCQHRTGEFVHDVRRRRLDDHILGKKFGQLPIAGKQFPEFFQLRAGRQLAEQQQPGDLLESETLLRGTAFHQLVDIVPTVGQPSLHRCALTFIEHIAVHVADQGQSRHHAAAVRIAQAALDVVLFKFLRVNLVIFLELIA